MDDEQPLDESARAAIRAYLQRAEVRISTQHRVATAFIGGAGLLVLIPIFLRDIVDSEVSFFLSMVGNHFPTWGSVPGAIGSVALLVTLGLPALLSMAIPVYGVYLLLKDLIQFYFTLYAPGFDHELLNPTLALGGINFSPDESPEAKQRIIAQQYNRAYMDYVMPFSEGRRELYFDHLIDETDGAILPDGRDVAALRDAHIIDDSPQAARDAQRLNAAMGLTRAIDRQLTAEAAISEMHLVRNTLYLRRLMLRYVKTLLLFIWTTIISYIMLPMLKDERFPNLLILALGYVVWSIAVMPILRIPAGWIYRHRKDGLEPHVDAQLMFMERRVGNWCRLAVVFSLIALVLAVLSTMQ